MGWVSWSRTDKIYEIMKPSSFAHLASCKALCGMLKNQGIACIYIKNWLQPLPKLKLKVVLRQDCKPVRKKEEEELRLLYRNAEGNS